MIENTYRVRLKTLSPLSVKSGESINFYEMFEGKEYLYYIDKNKLLKKLKKHDKDIIFIEKMTSSIMQTGNNRIRKLKDFLYEDCEIDLNERSDKELLEEMSFYKIRNKANSIKNTIYQFMRDSNFNPYVPGSSIKGAIRTAILSKIFEEQKDKVNSSNINWSSNGKYNNLVNRLFVKDNIINFENSPIYKLKNYDAKNDFFRFIQISDAKIIGKDNSEIVDFIVYGMKSKKNDPFNQEIIFVNTEFEFAVKFNKQGLEKWKNEFSSFGIQKDNSFPTNFDDIMFFTETFSKKIIEKETNYWRKNTKITKFYESISKESGLIRIGNGSGAHSMTLVNNLDELGVQIPAPRGILNNPKTRKMVQHKDGSMEPFGWCKMEIVEE